jgi:hypothetical protein
MKGVGIDMELKLKRILGNRVNSSASEQGPVAGLFSRVI